MSDPSFDPAQDHRVPTGSTLTPPAPPPSAGAPDPSAWIGDVVQRVGTLAEAVTGAVGELARSQRAVLDAIDTLRGGTRTRHDPRVRFVPDTPTGAGAPEPRAPSDAAHDLSPEPRNLGPYFDEVRRIVSDTMHQREQSLDRSAARDRYVRHRMADLPEAYRRQMPETDDVEALARSEQEVRRQFRVDFKAAGGQDPDVSGDAPGGRRPGAAVDFSRMSPLQQITLGLKNAPPGEGRSAAPAQPLRRAEPVPGDDASPDANGNAPAVSYGAD